MSAPLLPTPLTPPPPGSFVGPYVLGRPIGERGGSATVFLAYDAALDRAVALKRLDRGDGAGALAAEARRTCALAHPNIVTVHALVECDGVPYMAMEYLRDGSLRRQLGRLGPAHCARLLEGVLAGLEHMHERGILHRDIKPENVLLDGPGTAKLADLGIAVPAAAETPDDARTPLYAAPEHALGQPSTVATDLYAVGLLAYELLAGRHAFPRARTEAELLRGRLRAAPPAPASVEPAFAEWLGRLLATRPADRPASAREAWERLEEAVVERFGAMWRRSAASALAPRRPAPLPQAGAAPGATAPTRSAVHVV